MHIVKVRYGLSLEAGREYSYYSEEPLQVGDFVNAPTKNGILKARVTAVDVPEEEVAAFKDSVRVIPAGSKFMHEDTTFEPLPSPRDAPGFSEPPTEHEQALLDSGLRPFPLNGKEPESDGLAAARYAETGRQEEVELPSTAVIRIGAERDPRVLALYEEAQKLLSYAEARVIDSPAKQKEATDDLAIIAGVKKRLEEAKREYTGPIREHLDRFNQAFNNYVAPLLKADRINRQKFSAYQAQVAEAARKAEETNRMAAEVARRQAEESGTGEFTVDTTPVEAPAPARVVRSNVGSASMRDNWKARVVDFAKLPDEYKLADMQTLNAKARSTKGTATIPGVEFYNDQAVQVRSK